MPGLHSNYLDSAIAIPPESRPPLRPIVLLPINNPAAAQADLYALICMYVAGDKLVSGFGWLQAGIGQTRVLIESRGSLISK